MNSQDKGKRAEREACKLLSIRFNLHFDRSIGSGNRWAQVQGMSQAARHAFTGDLSCPDHFLWCVEVKSGYEDKINLATLAPNCTLDSFISQASKYAKRAGRKPLLLYKRARQPWLAILKQADLPDDYDSEHHIKYREWFVVPLAILLKLPDEFWLA